MCTHCNFFKEQGKEPDKAPRYLDLLDTARCNGKWQEVPELARKVEKHVPRRKCTFAEYGPGEENNAASTCIKSMLNLFVTGLILTAKTECSPQNRPISSTSDPIPPLLSVLQEETSFPEDAFEASVCLDGYTVQLGIGVPRSHAYRRSSGRLMLAWPRMGES